MVPKNGTEISLSTVVVALTAFVAVSPIATMHNGIVCAFVASIFGCWYFDMMALAISISLAFVALALRIKSCRSTISEPFARQAVDRVVTDDQDTYPESYNVGEPNAFEKVQDIMTKEDLQAFITPAHLEAAQSNLIA
jgi:hypothetical protein